MKKIYETASDLHIRSFVAYANLDDEKLYDEPEFINQSTTDELQKAFLFHALTIMVNDVPYEPLTIGENQVTLFVVEEGSPVLKTFETVDKTIDVIAEPESGEVNLFGKLVSDLQSKIKIDGENNIKGTLLYVEDYTGFSGDPRLQSGNFLALKVKTDPVSNITTTVELVGGETGHPVELDEDMNIVLRISDKDTQSIRIVSTDGTYETVKEYSLNRLTLNKN